MPEDFIRLTRERDRISVEGARTTFFGARGHVFGGWNFDGGALTVFNDEFGFYPLFYARLKNGIAVSPSLVKLLEIGAPADFDAAALAVFLRLNFFVGEDTPFRAIRALPPNAQLIWRDNQIDLSFKNYCAPRKLDLPANEIASRFAQLFRKSIAAMLPPDSDFAIPLSGGRDSRFIFFELHRVGAKPREVLTLQHFPPRADEDARLAKKICRRLDASLCVLKQPTSLLAAELEKNLRTHFCTDEHAWYLPLARHIENRGFERVYDGIAGDVLTGGIVFDPAAVRVINSAFENGDFRRAADAMLNEGYLPNLLRKNFLTEFSRETAIERLTIEVAKHRAAANPIVSFLFYNRTRREIALAPFGILNRKTTIYAPFLHPEIVELLLAVPFETSARTKLRDAAIAQTFPQFADIEFENRCAAPSRDSSFSRRFALELLRFAGLTQNSGFVRKSFWSPRLARCLIDRNYAAAVHDFGIQIVYLLQLERFVKALAK